MRWDKEFIYIPKYEHINSNQHGIRYKQIDSVQVCVANMSCKLQDPNDMAKLILLSNTLNTPVRYNFDEQRAYIELVSAEKLQEII